MSVPSEGAGARAVEGPRPKLTRRAAVLLVAVGLLTLLWMAPVRAYFDQRTQITGLERQVQQLEDANARLRSQVSKLHDPAELERLARACLGMVRPGEVAFVTAPAGGGSYPRDC